MQGKDRGAGLRSRALEQTIPFRQFGSVALVENDGEALCTATFRNGYWTAGVYLQSNETRRRSAPHVAPNLETLLDDIVWRAKGEL